MDYQSYVEWTELSAIYLRNYSQGDRYRTFKSAISAAGLNTLIVGEFLQDNRDQKLDVTDWRSYSVHEAGGDKRIRIQWTAAALEAIGAPEVADAVREAKSESPFDALMQAENLAAFDKALESEGPMELLKHFQKSVSRLLPDADSSAEDESELETPVNRSKIHGNAAWHRLAELLQTYVDQHRDDLQADIAKHGDPRAEPGFTRKGRLRQLDQMRTEMLRRESLAEEASKLRQLLGDLGKRIGDATEPTDALTKRIASPKRHFLKKLSKLRKDVAKTPVPAVRDCVQEAERFLQTHSAILGEAPLGKTGDEQRLAAFGDYEKSVDFGQTRLLWEMPQGFDVGWNHFELELGLDKNPQSSAIQALADVVERTRRQIKRLSEVWKQELIEHFNECQGGLSDWELEDAEFDEEGQVTESSILEMAGTGRIFITAYDPAGQEIECRVAFPIEWDVEHGFNLPWDDEPEMPEGAGDDVNLPATVRLVDCGPAIREADLDQLQQRYGVTLPDAYRAFLRRFNGGVPEPNHLPLRVEGFPVPYDIEFFYSLSGSEADSSATPTTLPAERSLEAALKRVSRHSMQQVMLPIAKLRLCSLWGEGNGNQDHLFLVLSGKRTGRVIVFEADPGVDFEGYRRISEPERLRVLQDRVQYSLQVAGSLRGLFSKLQPFPKLEMPDWLRMIHQDDQAGFMQWITAGGSMGEKYTGYGDHSPATVTEFLVRLGSPELLTTLVDRKHIKPKEIRKIWQQHFVTDLSRFRELMTVLPTDLWPFAMRSPAIWDRIDVLEQLAAAGVDFNRAIGPSGEPPIHLAVQSGHREAVKWLLAHGADPRKKDDLGRDAFDWTDNAANYDCNAVLRGEAESVEAKDSRIADSVSDLPGVDELNRAAAELPEGVDLMIRIQIKSPPVSRTEKAFFQECHYTLSMAVGKRKVTFNHISLPSQDYLYGKEWPETLFLSVLRWPDLTPLWDTLEVVRFDRDQAMRKRGYQPVPVPELVEPARAALELGFDAEQAASRKVYLRNR